MYQIFFTHSSVDGHLDCFNFGAFMNSTMGLVAQMVKNRPAIWETWVRSLGQEDPLEKEMATHSSILAWRISWTERRGGLQCIESHRVGHEWRDWAGWTVLFWKFMYRFVCGHMVLFLLAIYIGVQLPGRMVTLCLTLWETAKLLSEVAGIFYISTSSARGFSASLLTLGIIWPLIIVLLVSCHGASLWFSVYLMTNDVEHLSVFLLTTCISLCNMSV